MQYKPGTLSHYDDSMAERARVVFDKLWKEKYGSDLPSETKEDRRMLFVAIAQGVIQHFKDNALDAFDIEVNVVHRNSSGIEIKSKGKGKNEVKVEIQTVDTVDGGLYPWEEII